MVRCLEIQGLNCREILHLSPPKQSNTCLFRKKRRKNPKKNAHLHQRNQVFPISTTKTVLNWVLLASAASFPGTERICGNPSFFAGISMIFSVIPENPSEMEMLSQEKMLAAGRMSGNER